MKTQKKHRRLASLLIAGAAFTAACADSATAPARTLLGDAPSSAITQTFAATFPPGFVPFGITAGKVQLCKTANAAGTFGFSVSVNGGAASHVNIVLASAGTECTEVFASAVGNGPSPDQVVITEDADQTNWELTAINTIQFLSSTATYNPPRLSDAEDIANRKVTLYINNDMARRTTFTNTFTEPPPPTGCTYTKGWYQNKNGAPTVISVDGRSIADAQAIFAAKPGQLGGVTLSGTSNTNLLLNVYQQLLAALNNLGGDSHANDGPPAVDAAIALALSGTGGTGLDITTTLTVQQLGDIAATLGSFNEGSFEGWPHCQQD